MNGAICLCNNFTFASGSAATIRFPWVGFDSSHKEADLVIESKLVSSGDVDVSLDSSMDTTLPTALGTTNISAIGVTTTPITADLMPMVRLVIASDGAAGVTLSVWLVPKNA